MQLPLWVYVLLVLSSAANAGNNHVTSRGMKNCRDRIVSLKKYIRLASEIQDAEYDIYDVNLNAGVSIPGPTHRDYRLAVAIHRNDAENWLQTLTQDSKPRDVQWCMNLLKQNATMRRATGKPFRIFVGRDKVFLLSQDSSVGCLRIYQE